ncbi:hypothetical protein GMORB2_5090 [Geosmithia morbida]|uniref:Uncharacterized protein n=1 Tax=Geosmithia morbida TaxID=1094350 RepID=A0A9P4Z0K6_9HYPO|nr:uncharacterized protein GMORB2_5090 [Geosmithia morbida]KAF4124424.1 hypothetical protein GMORB2_5090 [Geosmithia morbida]
MGLPHMDLQTFQVIPRLLTVLDSSLNADVMGPNDLVDYVIEPAGAASANPTDTKDHGLRFTNEEWNGSITNHQAFALTWNESIANDQGNLRLFRIWYPENGVMSFEPVSNLTDSMDEKSCVWTPEGLSDDNLYTLWVTRETEDGESHWAISPPWKPLNEKRQEASKVRWRNSVGIPVVVVLAVYFISLTTCLLYRRRRKAKKAEKDQAGGDKRSASMLGPFPPEDDADRHPSVSSVGTAQTLTPDDDDLMMKKVVEKHQCRHPYIIRNPQQPPLINPEIAWNRVIWRKESLAEPPVPMPMPMLHGTPGFGDWDFRVPIGQAR